jgi:hypothetical protein
MAEKTTMGTGPNDLVRKVTARHVGQMVSVPKPSEQNVKRIEMACNEKHPSVEGLRQLS